MAVLPRPGGTSGGAVRARRLRQHLRQDVGLGEALGADAQRRVGGMRQCGEQAEREAEREAKAVAPACSPERRSRKPALHGLLADGGERQPGRRCARSQAASLPSNSESRIRFVASSARRSSACASMRARVRMMSSRIFCRCLVFGSTMSPSRPKRQAWKRLKV